MTTNSVITLTTDFGLKDAYVGAMKGVILGINPDATIVDISHEVPPQDVREAAFALYTAYRYFPPSTVHVVVVDPGVGGGRRAVVLKSERGVFVAPDNGVLTHVVLEETRMAGVEYSTVGESISIPSGMQAVDITNPEFWLPEVSSTFHGRDIFGPVAAHLSNGLDIAQVGEHISTIVTFRAARPYRAPDGALVGTIIYTDRFGNMVTNIRKTDLENLGAPSISIRAGDRKIPGLKNAYVSALPGQVLALIGSSNHMEIAVRNGSAARLLGLKDGDKVVVKPAE